MRIVRSVLLSMAIIANVCHAAFDDFTSTTWNMQGASSGGSSNWADTVAPLANAYQIVVLQEAGAVPGSAVMTGRYITGNFQVGTLNQDIYEVFTAREYTWGYSPGGTPRYVYHVEVNGDAPGTRTNLAIVTRFRADNILLLPPVYNQGREAGTANPQVARRPTLGIEVTAPANQETTTFYTFHAGSHGDTYTNDAPTLLRLLDTYHDPEALFNLTTYTYMDGGTVNRILRSDLRPPSPSFVVMGDFNRNIGPFPGDAAARARVGVPADLALLRTGYPTHVNYNTGAAAELDYAVTGNFTGGGDPRETDAYAYRGTALSDHGNVFFANQCHRRCLGGNYPSLTVPGTQLSVTLNNQVATNQVRVTLHDGSGNPVPNVAVQFRMHVGRGTLVTPTGNTNASGQFSTNVNKNIDNTASVVVLFDSSGDGTPDVPVINGSPAQITFATGG